MNCLLRLKTKNSGVLDKHFENPVFSKEPSKSLSILAVKCVRVLRDHLLNRQSIFDTQSLTPATATR